MKTYASHTENLSRTELYAERRAERIHLFMTIATIVFIVASVVGITVAKGFLAALPLIVVLAIVVLAGQILDRR